MATYTLTINERTTGAKNLIDFLKSLHYVELNPINKKEESKENSVLKSISDSSKSGNIVKCKNVDDMFNKLNAASR